MNKLMKSTLLTVVAVPFLMAAPTAAKKVQNTSTTAVRSTSKTKAKKVKKNKTTATGTAASSTPQK